MELDIAFLANVLGNKATMESFLEAAGARKNAINSVFWNGEKGQWFDYRLTNGTICKVFSMHVFEKPISDIIFFSDYFMIFVDFILSGI
jgi:neutral trehalase